MVRNRTTGNIGEMLLRDGLVTDKQLQAALKTQSETEKPLGRVLVEMGLISENVKMDFLRRKTGYPTVVLSEENIDSHILKIVPRNLALRYNVVPVRLEPNGLLIAMEDPTDLVLLDKLAEIIPMPIRPAIASVAEIESTLERYEAEEEAPPELKKLPLYLRQPTWYRVCRYLFMPLFMLVPLLIFFLLLWRVPAFSDLVWEAEWAHDPFDVFLYTLLGWGLWSVVIFEINGLLFGNAPPAKKPDV